MADLNQLYEILRFENMIEVRFTQIQEELTLSLLVAYFKQYYSYRRRVQRIVQDDQDSNSSSANDKASVSSDSQDAESPNLSTGINEEQQDKESEHNVETETEFELAEERYQGTIDYENHFKKSALGSTIKKSLIHPLYTKERKLDFLRKNVPTQVFFKDYNNSPEDLALSDSEAEIERKKIETYKRITYWQKVENQKEERRRKMRQIIKKVDQ